MKNLKPIHCYLIDDDPEEIDIFKMALEDLELTVNLTSFTDCHKAVEHLLSDTPSPDCIFLDLHLGAVNGKECLSKIKNTDIISHIPVVILSGSNIQDEIAAVKQLGAHEFILKASTIEHLGNELYSYFSTHYNLNEDISL